VLESAPTRTCGAEFVGGAVAYGREGRGRSFLLLVERVEDAIAAEKSATLNAMTLATESADTPSGSGSHGA
jgi:hypothetical protein